MRSSAPNPSLAVFFRLRLDSLSAKTVSRYCVGVVSNPLYTSSDEVCYHTLKASLASFVSMCRPLSRL